jgi:hypothetical protein
VAFGWIEWKLAAGWHMLPIAGAITALAALASGWLPERPATLIPVIVAGFASMLLAPYWWLKQFPGESWPRSALPILTSITCYSWTRLAHRDPGPIPAAGASTFMALAAVACLYAGSAKLAQLGGAAAAATGAVAIASLTRRGRGSFAGAAPVTMAIFAGLLASSWFSESRWIQPSIMAGSLLLWVPYLRTGVPLTGPRAVLAWTIVALPVLAAGYLGWLSRPDF